MGDTTYGSQCQMNWLTIKYVRIQIKRVQLLVVFIRVAIRGPANTTIRQIRARDAWYKAFALTTNVIILSPDQDERNPSLEHV